MYTCIVVSGADRVEFLQGQLTQDVARLSVEPSLGTAWCNAKGRVVVTGHLIARGDSIDFVIPEDIADAVLRRLTMYRLRAKVDTELDASAVPDDLPSPSERIAAGRVEIGAEASEGFTPHMLNLDLLGAVSFDKGCYTGQEVVARTHYRGATKRPTLRFESTEPVAPGDKVSAGERDVGEVLNAIGTDLLAVVPIDKADEPLTVNGIALKHVPLPYL